MCVLACALLKSQKGDIISSNQLGFHLGAACSYRK